MSIAQHNNNKILVRLRKFAFNLWKFIGIFLLILDLCTFHHKYSRDQLLLGALN